jgi:hypothetical protein
MDFHVIPPHGEAVLILSTDDRGRIVTPLPVGGGSSSGVFEAESEDASRSEAAQR